MDIQQPLTKKQRKELKRQEKLASKEYQEKIKMIKRVIMWSAAVVVVGLAVWGMSKVGSGGGNYGGELSDPVTDKDWQTGNNKAKVTLVEYSDFECPACGLFHKEVKKMETDFGDKFLLVYRHYPLAQHPDAETAARAAEAAGQQGKFWQMHDFLFERQGVWAGAPDVKGVLANFAVELGLDKTKFLTDMDSVEVADKIAADKKSGDKSALTATPTFFVNGKKLINIVQYDELRDSVLKAINNNP